MSCKGYTFLELILALAIFSAGLLGILQLQALTQRQWQESQYISVAIMQAYSASALLTSFAKEGDLSQPLSSWQADLAQLLPQGEGVITATTITVFWHDPLAAQHIHLQRE